jgi:hypothetical protein
VPRLFVESQTADTGRQPVEIGTQLGIVIKIIFDPLVVGARPPSR